MMLAHLEKEQEALFHHILHPVTAFICEVLPEGSRRTTRAELAYEDLESLPPEDVARACDWVLEKVDSISGKLKPEAKELELEDDEEPIGDVDLFSLTEDASGLQVNSKWLGHLQTRLLGEDGQPRKAEPGEDASGMGLVLEWAYGTIVSTAEKSRDGARRMLGSRPPSVEQALEHLNATLQDQAEWEMRAKASRDMLAEMLRSRKKYAEIAAKYNIKPPKAAEQTKPGEGPPAGDASEAEAAKAAEEASAAENGNAGGPSAGTAGTTVPPQEESDLPNTVILDLLRREVLLTKAKTHYLLFEQMQADRKLKACKSQLRQGEPEFERLKKELEEVKNQPRGLEGTYRTTAEMERHRAQLQDAALEEQIEVQTAYRETGTRLNKVYETKRELEVALARWEGEIVQLQKWEATIQRAITGMEVREIAFKNGFGFDFSFGFSLAIFCIPLNKKWFFVLLDPE